MLPDLYPILLGALTETSVVLRPDRSNLSSTTAATQLGFYTLALCELRRRNGVGSFFPIKNRSLV